MDINARALIADIDDRDFDSLHVPEKTLTNFRVRKAARGVLFDLNKIALLYVTLGKYHKLPGGGIENGEDHEEAFIREIKEETGCECRIMRDKKQDSVILETRDKIKLVQISYIFCAEIVGKPGVLHLTEKEIKDGFKLKWVTMDEALELIQSDHPDSYEGKFIQKRDLAILNFCGND